MNPPFELSMGQGFLSLGPTLRQELQSFRNRMGTPLSASGSAFGVEEMAEWIKGWK